MEASMATPNVTITIDGIEELERTLVSIADQYGPATARNTLRVPMTNAFRIVEEAIRNSTPVDTGELRTSVDLRTRVPNRATRRRIPDAVLQTRAGWFWTRPANLYFRAWALEYGTRFQPARSILRNALTANANAVLQRFGETVGNDIEQRATQLYQASRRRSLARQRRRR